MDTTTASATGIPFPTWDLTTIYPGVDSPELLADLARLGVLLDDLESDLAGLGALDAIRGDEVTGAFERTTGTLNESIVLFNEVYSYVQAHVSANSRDQAAVSRLGELMAIQPRIIAASARFTAGVARLDIDSLVESSGLAREHAFVLRQAHIEAVHLMDQPRETLAAELAPSGGHGWAQLRDGLASQIMVTIEMPDGEPVQLPISEADRFAVDPDRDVRRRAYEGRESACRDWEIPLAAALNAIKGEHITLSRARGWDSILDESLFNNRIDRRTLDAMLAACRRRLPDFHRYLDAKARALGLDVLAWYDLDAPLPGEVRTWSWRECEAFTTEQFEAFSPRLGGLARRAFGERWIDAGPRADKHGGAFCAPFANGVSRILMNCRGTFEDVPVLAHELGHAYHNVCQANVSPWRVELTPMTLMETASIFCQTLVTRAAITQAGRDERFTVLDSWLRAATSAVTRSMANLDFEQSLIAKRADRELAAGEITTAHLTARRAAFGAALDPDALAPHSWGLVPHYFLPQYAFYNYQYTFGLLFGLGLYARYLSDPDQFPARFDKLLALTGDADVATLTMRFGIDIRSEAFWEESLAMIRADIDGFVELVDQRLASA